MKKIIALCFTLCCLYFHQKALSQYNDSTITHGSSILAVKLISFQGKLNNNKVLLRWLIAKNETADRFDVERSADGINFTMAALVLTSEKNGNENYMFYENLSNKRKVYYRLKMYNKSQSINYSKTLVIHNTSNAK